MYNRKSLYIYIDCKNAIEIFFAYFNLHRKYTYEVKRDFLICQLIATLDLP